MVRAAGNSWEEIFLPLEPGEAAVGEAPLRRMSLENIPLRRQGKAFQREESGCTKAWEHEG